MNTYAKYCPNVFVAKCTESHEKGEVILLETKYGKTHECVVFNLVLVRDGFYYYSITRADGFNVQEWAKSKAERLNGWANNATKRSNQAWEAAQEGRDFLALAEPIKVGHHSEKRHRALIDRNWNRMGKSVAESEKAEVYQSRAKYWEDKADTINLSMPDSLEYFEYELEKSRMKHEELKSDPTKRSHSFSLAYAKKEVNEIEKKVELAKRLWA